MAKSRAQKKERKKGKEKRKKKKGGGETRENPENLTENVKQIKLKEYWLNQPFPSNTEI